MSFELDAEKSLRKNLRRIARKQMDNIVEELREANEHSRDQAVHEARKAFKKIRAVLRLVRPAIGDKTYREENTCFRDLGRPLTEVRDAAILLETMDKLIEHFKEQMAGRSFGAIREALETNRDAVSKRELAELDAFGLVGEAVRQARQRVKDWADVPDKWRAVGEGVKDVYAKAGEAYEDAAAEPTVAKLHEWRKQVKYLRYQVEILRPLCPERLEELSEETDRMGELLGDDHDLAVLRDWLTGAPAGAEEEGKELLPLIERRRTELEQEAMQLGQRFFQERPRDFARRLKGYWKTWRARRQATPAEALQTPGR